MRIRQLPQKHAMLPKRRGVQGYLVACLMVFGILLLGTNVIQVQSFVPPRQFTYEEFDYHGPYIDELVFSVHRGSGVQWQALIDHLIDVGDQPVTLQERADIEFDQWPVNAFWALACSTHDDPYYVGDPIFGPPEITGFPLNFVELRRAIAMAIDKYELASLSFGDNGLALDHVVPSSLVAWHKAELPVDYRGSDIDSARALLDDTGFIDLNGDGYREAPDSSEISIRLYYPALEEWAIRAGKTGVPPFLATDVNRIAESIGNTLGILGFDYNLYNVTEEMLYDITHFGGRSYHLALQPFIIPNHSPLYLNDLFFSLNIPTTNIMNFANDTVDAMLESLNTTSEYELFRETVFDLQVAIAQNQPLIPLITRYQYTAHRVDRFFNWINAPGIGSPNRWSLVQVRLKPDQVERNPITGVGGSLEFGLNSAPTTLNPIILLIGSSSLVNPYLFTSDEEWLVLNNIYSHLLDINPFTGEPVPGIAKRWLIEPEGDEIRIIFNLVNNATWHDGNQFTANDVNFTYHYINNLHKHWPAHFPQPLLEVSSIEVINNVTIAIQTPRKGYFDLFYLAGFPILPKHIWEGIAYPLRLENAFPIGTGPFRFHSRPEPNLIKLGYHENYHYGIQGARKVPTPVDIHLIGWLSGGIFVIVLTAVGAIWYLRRRPHGLSE